jgi:chemotaxis protein methyltransferase CheR
VPKLIVRFHVPSTANAEWLEAIMIPPEPQNLLPKPMTESTFRQFSQFIQTRFGIKMPRLKKNMLQTRLQKRMRHLNISSYNDYRDYVFSAEGQKQELQHMIDAVTTNKTDFFREPKHFQFISEEVIPALIHNYPRDVAVTVSVWSAGCSSGQEPYTLAIVLNELANVYQNLQFSILGTDLSMRMLHKAATGIYDDEDIAPISIPMRNKYFLRSKNRQKKQVRIAPGLRSLVEFRRLNLMSDNFGIGNTMDIIFCRNVLIYFERSVQEKIVSHLCQQLNHGGLLFVGHSETLSGMNLPLKQVVTTVYRKTSSVPKGNVGLDE